MKRVWGEERHMQALVGKPEGKRPFRRPTHRLEHNIKMYLEEVLFWCMDWIELALVNAVMNLRVP